jgi:hypothetical protein
MCLTKNIRVSKKQRNNVTSWAGFPHNMACFEVVVRQKLGWAGCGDTDSIYLRWAFFWAVC